MNKNLPLESMRGIAAVMVVLYHFQVPSPLVANRFIHHCNVMVDFFFVLSGYVIALNYQHRLNTFSDLITFQKRRFWRLYPLHFATLLLFVMQDIAKAMVIAFTNVQTATPAFEANYLYKLVNNLTLTHAIFLNKMTFNTPSWSISTEFYTYIIFALTIYLIRRQRALVYLAIAITAGVIVRVYGDGLSDTAGLGLFRCMCSFFSGAFVFKIIGNSKVQFNSVLPSITLLASLLATIYLAHSPYEMWIPLIFSLTIVTIVMLKPDALLQRMLSLRPLVYLGTISYSVYLIHSAVLINMARFFKKVLHIPLQELPDGRTQMDMPVWMANLAVVIALILVLGISHLTYKFIEDRFRHGLRKKVKPQPTPAIAKA